MNQHDFSPQQKEKNLFVDIGKKTGPNYTKEKYSDHSFGPVVHATLILHTDK